MKKSLCPSPGSSSPAETLHRAAARQQPAQPVAGAVAQGEAVKPPFAVEGEADGLLLVWYDEQGAAHPASNRGEIPESHRASVRVDALELAPEQRLDPAFVYVADLRAPRRGAFRGAQAGAGRVRVVAGQCARAGAARRPGPAPAT